MGYALGGPLRRDKLVDIISDDLIEIRLPMYAVDEEPPQRIDALHVDPRHGVHTPGPHLFVAEQRPIQASLVPFVACLPRSALDRHMAKVATLKTVIQPTL
jgi:hypothetical protein